MGSAQDPENSAPVDATHSAGPLRSMAGWAAGLSNLTKLIVAVTGLLVAGAGLIAVLGLGSDKPGQKSVETTPGEATALSVTFSIPTNGSIVPRVVNTTGVIRGFRLGTTFWIGASASDDPHWHPQDTPCLVDSGGAWACGDLFVGNAADAGRRFRVYGIVADDQATIALRLYGQRNKNEPGAYQCLINLPQGAQVIGVPIEVTRR